MAAPPHDILCEIAARRLLDVAAAQKAVPLAALESRARACFPLPPVDLWARTQCTDGRVCIAAEFKRASPSKGAIVPASTAVVPAVLAYCDGGADVISVLTEPTWFAGTLDDMEATALAAAEWSARTGRQRPAILRKDFIVDAYQISEARAFGADTVLLIVSLLPTAVLLEPLIRAARVVGMEPLVEVNSTAEMVVAAEAGARVIGVNNRNLRTFVVDMGTTPAVVAHVAREWAAGGSLPRSAPPAVLSLSGLRAPADGAELLRECERAVSAVWRTTDGAAAVPHAPPLDAIAAARAVMRGLLIGEALMRSSAPAALVAGFVEAGSARTEAAAAGGAAAPILAKICGVKHASAALHAARCGCHLVGLILVPGSARFVDPAAAAGITAALRAYREQDPAAELSVLAAAAREAALSFAHSGATAAAAVRAALLGLRTRGALLRRAVSRARPLAVGVFLDQPLEEVFASAASAGVDLVQLHGAEDAGEVAAAALAAVGGAGTKPVIKVLHVPAGDDAVSDEAVLALAQQCVRWARAGAAALLLDTAAAAASPSSTSAAAGSASRAGGTGARFSHASVLSRLRLCLQRLCEEEEGSAPAPGGASAGAALSLPLLVAGGLTAGNVAEAAALCLAAGAEPPEASTAAHAAVSIDILGLDVSSGVEVPVGQPAVAEDGAAAGAIVAAKGCKDPRLVAAFVRAVAESRR